MSDTKLFSTANTPAMSLDAYQERVHQWISKFEEGYFPALVNMSRLMEEVGELARAISHADGHKKPKKGEALGSIEEEIADILFVLVCLANQRGIRLNDAVLGNLAKIDRRDTERWTLKDDSRH